VSQQGSAGRQCAHVYGQTGARMPEMGHKLVWIQLALHTPAQAAPRSHAVDCTVLHAQGFCKLPRLLLNPLSCPDCVMSPCSAVPLPSPLQEHCPHPLLELPSCSLAGATPEALPGRTQGGEGCCSGCMQQRRCSRVQHMPETETLEL
jgi:hypothetical protein